MLKVRVQIPENGVFKDQEMIQKSKLEVSHKIAHPEEVTKAR